MEFSFGGGGRGGWSWSVYAILGELACLANHRFMVLPLYSRFFGFEKERWEFYHLYWILAWSWRRMD